MCKKTDFSCKMIYFPPGIGKKKAKRKSSIIEKRSGVAKEKGEGGEGKAKSRHIFYQVVLLVRLILTNCAPSRVNLLFCCFSLIPHIAVMF
jgi:hypothetical protein